MIIYENVFMTIRETSFNIYSFDFISKEGLISLSNSGYFSNVHKKKNLFKNTEIDREVMIELCKKFELYFKELINDYKNKGTRDLCIFLNNIDKKKLIKEKIKESKDKIRKN